MAEPSVAEFTRLVDALVSRGEPIDLDTAVKLAGEISKAFGVKSDEVAILKTTPDERFLQFVIQAKFQNLGTIPINSTSALSARTAREKRPEILNNFTIARHSTVFEAVPLEQKRGDPIQKIMSVPITHDVKVTGVIQISRKGKSVTSSGQDFTPKELSELAVYAAQVARFLSLIPTP
jgi:hypothetical protein